MSAAPAEFEVLSQPKKPNGSEALVVATPTPLSLLQQAISQGVSIEMLERFQAMYERDQAMQAKRAFTEAMAAFKSETIRIVRDKTNNQYSSRYVSIGNLVNTVTPFLSKNSLSARWDIDQSGKDIRVTCIIEHAMGHRESVSMSCPPDTSGQKNPIQQIKSAITYAKVCTFESACGLASSDANLDDDANSTTVQAGKQSLSDERFTELQDWIENAQDDAQLKTAYMQACKEADAVGDMEAKRLFNQCKNKMYRELHK